MNNWVQSNPNIAPLRDVMADDLKKRDVAYFTRELGSGDVFHNGTAAIKRDRGEDFFEDDGLEGVRQQLAILRDPKGLEFLKTCGTSFTTGVRDQCMNESQTDANREARARLKQEHQAGLASVPRV